MFIIMHFDMFHKKMNRKKASCKKEHQKNNNDTNLQIIGGLKTFLENGTT